MLEIKRFRAAALWQEGVMALQPPVAYLLPLVGVVLVVPVGMKAILVMPPLRALLREVSHGCGSPLAPGPALGASLACPEKHLALLVHRTVM
jgi:hypothetical protein